MTPPFSNSNSSEPGLRPSGQSSDTFSGPVRYHRKVVPVHVTLTGPHVLDTKGVTNTGTLVHLYMLLLGPRTSEGL